MEIIMDIIMEHRILRNPMDYNDVKMATSWAFRRIQLGYDLTVPHVAQ